MERQRNGAGFFFIPVILIVILLFYMLNSMDQQNTLSYQTFQKMVDNGEISSVSVYQNREVPTGRLSLYDTNGNTSYVNVTDVNQVTELLEQNDIDYTVQPVEQENIFIRYVMPALLIGLVLLVGFSLMTRSLAGGGNNRMMNFGKSNAHLSTDGDKKILFRDVAGLEEEKEDLVEVVDFLKAPEKYTRVGARIPKGVLLVGPPGTGKTLLAKAVAGEAGVPFFSISGSDFVEMFVGVGASRVRDLFEKGKAHAPCIIFIDEIDAVARRRGTGMGGGHDEREQTLNQLLVEMDGFGVNEGIIVMAATNRVDILDPAILRPGRFDRRVVVGPPDVKGREEILYVHAKNKPLGEDVDLKQIAQTTAGFTGAQLENLLNESAIIAARDSRNYIMQKDIRQAFIKVGIGTEKKSRVISEKEKRITAYHETGHAILFHVLPEMEAVYTISIIPTGPGAAGYTMPQPENDEMFNSRGKMLQYITVCLGGRVAEELIFDDITTGASQDIKQATSTARAMVTQYGMSSRLGLVAYDDDSNEVFIGRDWGHTKTYSEDVAAAIDEEVKAIIEECHERARKIIQEHTYVLHTCAARLIEKEKLTRPEFEAIFDEENAGASLPEDLQFSGRTPENGEA
ncbi:MAG TPA: ATP-dependent zinc metalloprotease FtsH [Candidatus Fusicatenibacter merdavium]|uniref:ATP-dependent zinc metalloprotease FtsH n=1 Tax=Candidatus Fusicatenibacter merdavium TaxID=2838600 RepID=A0A9D1XDE7_9FIRM|nr:ATP-dependent zinc metalloprotease FtsH [Candidatus Fusicatenibacter merdavium]